MIHAALLLSCALLLAAVDATAADDRRGATPGSPLAAPAGLVAGGLLDIQTVVGFSDTFRIDRWTPVTVVVSNRGRDLVGELEVQTTGGDELQGNLYTTTHRQRLELPRDSRKRFRFTVYLESASRPLLVRVTAGGREVAREPLDLRTRFTTARLLLVLSRDADLDYLNDGAGDGLRVLYPHPELLPDRWAGYDGVEAVVIHGVSLEHLSARQYDALDRWVTRGGIVAVSGGPDYSLLRTPRLAALLPATPVGTVRFADGAAVGEALRAPLHAPRPFDVNRLAGFRGRVLYRAGDVPLVVEEERGRGRVLYLTIDVARYPFDRWSGMRELWAGSLRLPPAEPVSLVPARDEEGESAVLAVVRGLAREFPGHGVVLVFLGLYLGVLATGYGLQSTAGAGRRLAAWSTLASPLIFAPAAYLLFGPLLFPGGATAVVVSTIEPHARGPHAELTLDIGVYANRTTSLRLGFDGPEPVFRPPERARRQGDTADWVFHEGRASAVQPVDGRKYALHVLEGRDVIVFDVHASAAHTEEGLRLVVRNYSGRPLRDAWLVLDDNAYWLGPIPGDASLERTLDPAAEAMPLGGNAWRATLGAAFGPSERAARAAESVLARKMGEADEDGHPGPHEALLVGLSTSPLHLAGASAAWQRREVAVVLVRLPVARRSPRPMEAGPEEMEHGEIGHEAL